MSIFPQLLLPVHDELAVDLFAGGGGASTGIEAAIGRQVDIAINHDADAVAMHAMNHPQTNHFRTDVFDVDPVEATSGRPVGLLWASPDCTYYSKARGGKPIRAKNKRRRSLAWVVTRWAGTVRPRVIILENVEEFREGGPLIARRDPSTGRVLKQDGDIAEPGEVVPLDEQQLVPDPERAGEQFAAWKRSLEDHGYRVEWREMTASDYGAPTSRTRLFIIARCDDQPIIWPAKTHGPGRRQAYKTVADCIDWTYPSASIFFNKEESKAWARDQREQGYNIGTPRRPLADNTLRRIARGVVEYVLQDGDPFVVPVQNGSNRAVHQSTEPLRTVTAKPVGGGFALCAPTLVQTGYGERPGQKPRSLNLHEPVGTLVGGGQKHALISAFCERYVGPLLDDASNRGIDSHLESLLVDSNAHRVYGFIQSYYGEGIGQEVGRPIRTITTKDRMSLVTITVERTEYVISDIALRMLQPHELYRAQGFPIDYVIDRGVDGRRLTKGAQVRMCGNSVCPPLAASLVRTNCPDMIVRDEAIGRQIA